MTSEIYDPSSHDFSGTSSLGQHASCVLCGEIEGRHLKVTTPLPWNVDVMGYLRGPNNENILDVKANAAFIVRAVNSYYDREAFLLAVSRGACLNQKVGDRCICYPCRANELLTNGGK